MSFLFGNRSSKTFKPKKNIPEGSHQHELMKHAAATLGSGELVFFKLAARILRSLLALFTLMIWFDRPRCQQRRHLVFFFKPIAIENNQELRSFRKFAACCNASWRRGYQWVGGGQHCGFFQSGIVSLIKLQILPIFIIIILQKLESFLKFLGGIKTKMSSNMFVDIAPENAIHT